MSKRNQAKNKAKRLKSSRKLPLRKKEGNKGEINTATVTEEKLSSNKSANKDIVSKAVPSNRKEAEEQVGGASSEGSASGAARTTEANYYKQLNHACARSTHLQGKLRQQQNRLIVELPAALPSNLLLRALQRRGKEQQALTAERLMVTDPHTELQLNVDGLTEYQLNAFVSELDELIGEFTGRS